MGLTVRMGGVRGKAFGGTKVLPYEVGLLDDLQRVGGFEDSVGPSVRFFDCAPCQRASIPT